MKHLILKISIAFFILVPLSVFSQENLPLMKAEHFVTHYYTDNANGIEWSVIPRIKCDILKLYKPNAKKQKVKFVSDVDSIEFTVKKGKPIDFNILLKGDTAHTRIIFNNELPNTISTEDKLLALSLFWSEAKYNFAFFDNLTFDWDSLYRSYIPLVIQSKNDLEFGNIMRKFVGTLQDGHTNFAGPYYAHPYGDVYGLGVKFFSDTLRVIMIDSLLSEKIPLGSKILKINNIPTMEYIETFIYPYVTAHYPPTQRMLAENRFFNSHGHSNEFMKLSFLTPSGEMRNETIFRDGSSKQHPRIGRIETRPYDTNAISWIDKNIAILTLTTFKYEEIVDWIRKNRDTLYTADGIIIDIRNNQGGSTHIAKYFLQYLIKDSVYLGFGSASRLHNGVKKAQGNFISKWEEYYRMRAYDTVFPSINHIPDSIRRFECPIVILTSTWTVSAAEDFLIMLYERPDRPKFIGRPTFGSTGAPLVIKNWPIPNSFARICARKVLYPYSLKAFDEGIVPDIWIEPTFEDFMSGKDIDIEAAVKEIELQLNAKKE